MQMSPWAVVTCVRLSLGQVSNAVLAIFPYYIKTSEAGERVKKRALYRFKGMTVASAWLRQQCCDDGVTKAVGETGSERMENGSELLCVWVNKHAHIRTS